MHFTGCVRSQSYQGSTVVVSSFSSTNRSKLSGSTVGRIPLCGDLHSSAIENLQDALRRGLVNVSETSRAIFRGVEGRHTRRLSTYEHNIRKRTEITAKAALIPAQFVLSQFPTQFRKWPSKR